jgi:hypothetical protein|nr:MAG: hypothetical protein J07AB56_01320 [Candidatus Nanosalinarum sp. J07AB56]
MPFKASLVYLMLIQGFGFLLGFEYSAFQLFGLSSAVVALFNVMTYFDYFGPCGMVDEREMQQITDSAVYGIFTSMFLASMNLGLGAGFSTYELTRYSFAVFMAALVLKQAYQRYGISPL